MAVWLDRFGKAELVHSGSFSHQSADGDVYKRICPHIDFLSSYIVNCPPRDSFSVFSDIICLLMGDEEGA